MKGTHAQGAPALQTTTPRDQQAIAWVTTVVTAVFTASGSVMKALQLRRRTVPVATGITETWLTPAVKAAVGRHRAALKPVLCRRHDASARSDSVSGVPGFTAAVQTAPRAHRSQHERACAHHCLTPQAHVPCTNGSNAWRPHVHSRSMGHSHGTPSESLRRPESGGSSTAAAPN